MAILDHNLTAIKLHLPISVAVDVASSGIRPDDLAQNLRSIFELRKERVPALYSHLEFSVDPFRGVSQCFPASWMSCDLNAARRQAVPSDTYRISSNEETQLPTIQSRNLSVPVHQGQFHTASV